MKSFFALASAFALAFVPVAIAGPAPLRFRSESDPGFVLGTFPHPQPGSLLIITDSPLEYATFILSDNGLGPIKLVRYPEEDVLCVTGGDHVAAIDECRHDDRRQDWEANDTGSTVITNEAGKCFTSPSRKERGTFVAVAPCQDPPPKDQLWKVEPVESSAAA